MQFEIDCLPAFSGRKRADLGMHSLLNLLNVLIGQLYVIGIVLEDREDFLAGPIGEIKNLLGKLEANTAPVVLLDAEPEFKQTLLRELEHSLAGVALDDTGPEIAACFETIDDCLDQLSSRCCEVVHLLNGKIGALSDQPVFQRIGQFVHHSGVGRTRAITVDLIGDGLALEARSILSCLLPFLLEYSGEGCRWEVEGKKVGGGDVVTIGGSSFAPPDDLVRALAQRESLPYARSLAGLVRAVQAILGGGGHGLNWIQNGAEVTLSWQQPAT